MANKIEELVKIYDTQYVSSSTGDSTLVDKTIYGPGTGGAHWIGPDPAMDLLQTQMTELKKQTDLMINLLVKFEKRLNDLENKIESMEK